jgi:hypothetical protein
MLSAVIHLASVREDEASLAITRDALIIMQLAIFSIVFFHKQCAFPHFLFTFGGGNLYVVKTTDAEIISNSQGS